MRNSPFAIFRKHQKIAMVVLAIVALFIFVIGDAISMSDGAIPTSLLALIGASIGALIFWLLGSSGGKGTEWAIVGALLGGVVVLVLPRFFDDRGVVSTSVGNLSEAELIDLRRRRRTANEFVRDIYAVGNPFPERLADISPELADMENSDFGRRILGMQQQQWSGLLSSYQFGGVSEEGVLTTWLLAHEADEMGIVISDDAVTGFLKEVANDKLRGQDLIRIRKEHGLSESQLYDILRYELKAQHTTELSVPRHLATPEDLWDWYSRFNVRQELVLTAIPVERFVDKSQEPPRAELIEFFEKHKERFPAEGEPGFHQPRKIQLAYLEADFESIRNKLFPEPITDEQVREYYRSHRDEFRNPAYKPEETAPAAGGPAAGEPSDTQPTRERGTDAEPGTEAVPPTANDGAAARPAPADGSAAAPAAASPAAPAESPADPARNANPPPGAQPDPGQAGLPSNTDLVNVSFLAQEEPAAPAAAEQPAETPPTPPAESPPGDAPAAAQPAPSAPADRPDAPPATPEAAAAQPPAARPAAARPVPLPPPLPEDPVSEFLTYEEVQDRIRSQLEQERDQQVRTEIDRLLDLAERRMYELARAYKAPSGDAERLTAAQVSEQLQDFARKHDLRYVVTELMSYEQLEKETVGQMTDANAAPFDGSPPLADQIFQSGPDATYVQIRFRDLATGNQIIGWKIEHQASRTPQFTDEGLEQQVLEAWRTAQARPKAQERAEALAKLVREHPEKDMQQALSDETLTGAADGLELTVRTTRSFTWLRQSSAPDPSQLRPSTQIEQSSIDGVEKAGLEFMETVFNELDQGAVGVVPNSDKSVYYIVKVVNRSSATESGRKVLFADLLRAPLFEQQSPYPRLLGSLQQELAMAWFQRLGEKYKIDWHRPADQLRPEF